MKSKDYHLHRRRFWALSIANWIIAILAWGTSAYLGISNPTGMVLYTVLFVIGILAVVVGIVAYLVARFAVEVHYDS